MNNFVFFKLWNEHSNLNVDISQIWSMSTRNLKKLERVWHLIRMQHARQYKKPISSSSSAQIFLFYFKYQILAIEIM